MITKTITDPLSPDIKDAGEVQRDRLLEEFSSFPWDEFSKKMREAKESEVCFSPSLGFKNSETNHKIEISYVEQQGDKAVYYLFYVRPKEEKKLFGFKTVMNPEYVSDLLDASTDDCIKFLNLYAKDEYSALEEMFAK